VGRRFFNRKKHRNSTLATWTLSFGRHQGQRLCDVPRDYLRWALTADGIPEADLWVIQQFISPSSRGPTYDSAASNRCVNDVMGTAGKPAESGCVLSLQSNAGERARPTQPQGRKKSC
jgi:uncharacterized protein (DUF3820 family)